MNDDGFDAFLRDALRQPAPSAVPDEARASEIAHAVSVALDDLVWSDDALDVDDHPNADDGEGGSALPDDSSASNVWDQDDAGDAWGPDGSVDDDPLLDSAPPDRDPGDGRDADDWHGRDGHVDDAGGHGHDHLPFDPPGHGSHDIDGE